MSPAEQRGHGQSPGLDGDKAEVHQFASSCLTSLQSAVLDLHYLSEGNANIIYSVSVNTPDALAVHAHCCVLRMRKNLSFTRPAQQVMADYDSSIRPLLVGHEDLLLPQALYRLSPQVVDEANAELEEMDGVDLSELTVVNADKDARKKVRHKHRRLVYLPTFAEEEYGILMPNLQGPGIDWLVEFKPKWLVQSPSAPPDAKNCRTCALNAMRRARGKHQGRGDSGFCPFDLLSDNGEVLSRALANIWPLEEGIELFVREFERKVQPALRHLVDCQKVHGKVGLDDFRNPDEREFGVAMALRDCSVFLAMTRKTDGEQNDIEIADVKLADLDLKSIDGGKLEKWASMEEELLTGNWYTDTADTACVLSR